MEKDKKIALKLLEDVMDALFKKSKKNEIECFECGAPVDSPPYPYCCTLINGSKCQAELYQSEFGE